MKGTGKIILAITGSVCLALFYVHLQIASFIVSYDIHSQSRIFTAKEEAYRHLKFEVDRLKAPRLLEEKIAEHQMHFALPDKVRVISVPAYTNISQPLRHEMAVGTFQASLSNFFGQWVQVAQAELKPTS